MATNINSARDIRTGKREVSAGNLETVIQSEFLLVN